MPVRAAVSGCGPRDRSSDSNTQPRSRFASTGEGHSSLPGSSERLLEAAHDRRTRYGRVETSRDRLVTVEAWGDTPDPRVLVNKPTFVTNEVELRIHPEDGAADSSEINVSGSGQSRQVAPASIGTHFSPNSPSPASIDRAAEYRSLELLGRFRQSLPDAHDGRRQPVRRRARSGRRGG